MIDNLKEIARNLNIEEKVYFVGYLAGKEVQKMYKAADVAVFPSTYEPFRNSCIRRNASEKFQLLYQMLVGLMK
jgi:glycosyltransferase, family 1